ncbi:MAG: 50S ribosomal protein L35 [Armatimonadota bacterium]|nr:50S ribosomal protein L35 [Armatimonadota bacterium]
MKTKKAAAKRFKRTGSGKLMYSSQGQNHLSMKKSSGRQRRLARDKELTGKDQKNIETLLPYD